MTIKTFNIVSVGSIFAADMSFVGVLIWLYTEKYKNATQAFMWGTLILALFSISVVPIIYMILKKVDVALGMSPPNPSGEAPVPSPQRKRKR